MTMTMTMVMMTMQVSSCDNLLRSPAYRVSLGLMAALALLGNLTVFVTRGCVSRSVAESRALGLKPLFNVTLEDASRLVFSVLTN